MSDWKREKRHAGAYQILAVVVFAAIVFAGMWYILEKYGHFGGRQSTEELVIYVIIATIAGAAVAFVGDRKEKAANKMRMLREGPSYHGGRPGGVLALGIISLIFGIWTVFDGVTRASMVVQTPFLGPLLTSIPLFNDLISIYLSIVAIMAAFYFAMTGALFAGRNWGRELVRILAILGGLASFFSIFMGNLIGILYLIVFWIVYWYMGQKHVEEFFFFNSHRLPKNDGSKSPV